MADLPEPQYVTRDASQILAECIASYEASAGRTLLPTQVERLVIDLIVYREMLMRAALQDAAKQNLLKYSRYPMIDLLAEIVGTDRIPARPATVPLRWSIAAPAGSPQVIPSGTKVRTKNRRAVFVLLADATIATGATYVDTVATCEAPGIVGNGYGPGSIELVAAAPFPLTLTVLAESGGGAPSESTDALRARVPTVLDTRAAAGPKEAYEAHARGAHVDVIDVVALTPSPGLVRIVVLPRAGSVPATVVAAVEAAVTAPNVKPMTDTVAVEAAVAVTYAITGTLEVAPGLTTEEETAIVAAATASATAFAAERAAGLGRSVALSQAYVALSVSGVISVPSLSLGGPSTVVVPADQVADCTAINVVIA
jgi:phage-related baseplate assembly protein